MGAVVGSLWARYGVPVLLFNAPCVLQRFAIPSDTPRHGRAA